MRTTAANGLKQKQWSHFRREQKEKQERLMRTTNSLMRHNSCNNCVYENWRSPQFATTLAPLRQSGGNGIDN